MICPTSEKRQHFHPLLYQCFQTQTYEPKELVVVDTGYRPSEYLMACAKTDRPVAYYYFSVDDAVHEPSVGSIWDGTVCCGSATRRPRHLRRPAWSLGIKRNVACCLATGAVLVQFDDDDLYAPNYLTWMLPHLGPLSDGRFRASAAKLAAWHLLDMSDLTFGFLDVRTDKGIRERERRGWVYGWGFSLLFTRAAWELTPLPDVEYSEDIGYVESLLARKVPVTLVQLPDISIGMCAHSYHPGSTSGGEFVGEVRCGRVVAAPDAFNDLMPIVREVCSAMTPIATNDHRVGLREKDANDQLGVCHEWTQWTKSTRRPRAPVSRGHVHAGRPLALW